jgi:D-amino-acid oxidase
MVDLSLRVQETTINVDALRRACWQRLLRAGVDVRLNTRWPVGSAVPDQADWVVIATYAELNAVPGVVPASALAYQFEICEKPLLRLPQEYRGTSMVVLDGPFMCFDPVAGTEDTFLAGNVRHAIHATTVGRYPLIPAGLAGRLNNGLHRQPPSGRWKAFIADGARFFTGFQRAAYLGSLFTTRAVLPGLEDTDARPTLVRRIDERTVTVFGGKISTCVEAAHDVVRLIAGQSTPVELTQRNEVPDYVSDAS